MTNFLQFDPVKNNMQSDSIYQSSSFRNQGAQTGVASSSAHNKLFYQLSTMVTALAQMMESKGYDIEDTSISDLMEELKNIMTRADMNAYALSSSLSNYVRKDPVTIITSSVNTSYALNTSDFYKTMEGAPASSTTMSFTLPAVGSLPNGAWVKIKNVGKGDLVISGVIDGVSPATTLHEWDEIVVYSDGQGYRGKVISTMMSLDFEASKTTNGFQKLPGGLILQWGHYDAKSSGHTQISINFPIPFPTACFNMSLTNINKTAANYYNTYLHIVSLTTTGATIFIDAEVSIGVPTQYSDGIYWMVIGH